MRYALSVEIKLTELPQEESQDEPRPGSDPLVAVESMMATATKLLRPAPYAFPMQPAGIDFRKQVAVSVISFATLAKIIEQYDSLTREIEMDRI